MTLILETWIMPKSNPDKKSQTDKRVGESITLNYLLFNFQSQSNNN